MLRGTPSTVGGHRVRRAREDALGAARVGGGARAKLENPGYVKFRKGGEPHETNPDVVERWRCRRRSLEADLETRARAREASPRRRLGRSTRSSRRSSTDASRSSCATCSSSSPQRPPVPLDEVEPGSRIVKRFSSGRMSHGSLSAEAHETIARAFNNLGSAFELRRGRRGSGALPDRPQLADQADRVGALRRHARVRRVRPELQIKIAQGSKPGEGGQLPGHKVTAEIARLRHTQPGVALISPPPHHDIYSIEDLAQLIFDLKQVNPDADVSVKLVAEAGVGLVAAGVVKALADVVHIAGADGGTGASPLSSIKNAGAPWELGLAETQQALVEKACAAACACASTAASRPAATSSSPRCSAPTSSPSAPRLLLAEGCLMVRSCHLDTCPVGIATQRPELRAKFAATPGDGRELPAARRRGGAAHLASLGLRNFDEAVGRVDLLRHRSDLEGRAAELELLRCSHGSGSRSGLPLRGRAEAPGAPAASSVGAWQRTPTATPSSTSTRSRTPIAPSVRRLGGKLAAEFPDGEGVLRRYRFTGQAGQSFGAFLPAGVEFVLDGEANDYVGKSLSGGRIVVARRRTTPARPA